MRWLLKTIKKRCQKVIFGVISVLGMKTFAPKKAETQSERFNQMSLYFYFKSKIEQI